MKIKELELKELEPRLNRQGSFGHKALVIVDGEVAYLFSYETLIAQVDQGTLTVVDTYSATTLKHIKEFAYQYAGLTGLTKQKIKQEYMG